MSKETIPQSIIDKINEKWPICPDPYQVQQAQREAAIWCYGLDKWISVKDGLPEELVDVLVCMKRLNSDNYSFIVADYYEGQWNAGDKEDLDNNPDFYVVTHYQYLPKPPKDI